MTKYIVIYAYEQKKMGGVCVRVQSLPNIFSSWEDAEVAVDELYLGPAIVHDTEIVSIDD